MFREQVIGGRSYGKSAAARQAYIAARERGEDVSTFDYQCQAWLLNGIFVRCAHPVSMNCSCYGKIHEGEKSHGHDI